MQQGSPLMRRARLRDHYQNQYQHHHLQYQQQPQQSHQHTSHPHPQHQQQQQQPPHLQAQQAQQQQQQQQARPWDLMPNIFQQQQQNPQQPPQQTIPTTLMVEMNQVPVSLPLRHEPIWTTYTAGPHISISSLCTSPHLSHPHSHPPHISPCQVHGLYPQQTCSLGGHHYGGFTSTTAQITVPHQSSQPPQPQQTAHYAQHHAHLGQQVPIIVNPIPSPYTFDTIPNTVFHKSLHSAPTTPCSSHSNTTAPRPFTFPHSAQPLLPLPQLQQPPPLITCIPPSLKWVKSWRLNRFSLPATADKPKWI